MSPDACVPFLNIFGTAEMPLILRDIQTEQSCDKHANSIRPDRQVEKQEKDLTWEQEAREWEHITKHCRCLAWALHSVISRGHCPV